MQFYLTTITKNSTALREEVDYGINTKGLPVIVVYPDYTEKSDIAKDGTITQAIKDLWDKLPKFRDSMGSVPTIHVPKKKDLIKNALNDTDFMVNTKTKPGVYFYT